MAEALREVLKSGVEFDDKRMNYVVMQIDRDTLNQARAALSSAAALKGKRGIVMETSFEKHSAECVTCSDEFAGVCTEGIRLINAANSTVAPSELSAQGVDGLSEEENHGTVHTFTAATIKGAIFDVIDAGQDVANDWIFDHNDESDEETERRYRFAAAVIARALQLKGNA